MRRRLPLSLGDLFRQPGYHLEEVTDHAEVGDGEDGRVAVLVDGNDRLGGLHPGAVLDRPGDPDRHVELRRDRLAGLADLVLVRVPAGIDRCPAGADRRPEGVGHASTSAKLAGSCRPRPPETMISASATSGLPPCSEATRSITRTSARPGSRVSPRSTTSGLPPDGSGTPKALGLTVSSGVPLRTRERTVVAPPKTLWVATSSASRSTMSASTPQPLRAARRAATSLPDGVAATRIAAGWARSAAATSASTAGRVDACVQPSPVAA